MVYLHRYVVDEVWYYKLRHFKADLEGMVNSDYDELDIWGSFDLVLLANMVNGTLSEIWQNIGESAWRYDLVSNLLSAKSRITSLINEKIGSG